MAFCSFKASFDVLLHSFVVYFLVFQCGCAHANSTLVVDASNIDSARRISNTFFGAFIEEINHAGAGGLWSELVRNRGFEAGSGLLLHWTPIGNESLISISINSSSCFERNKIALYMGVHCGVPNIPCPPGGVGVSNPGYWGMNIEQGKKYKVVYFIQAQGQFDITVSFNGVDGKILASYTNRHDFGGVREWRKVEIIVQATATDHNAHLQLTTTTHGDYFIDQVSAIPLDTYRGHGFRKDLFLMVANLRPKFLRFPGGTYVEGDHLANQYRWKETIGPWEERPGHFNDIWNYWSDDGLGFQEYLQLAEDLNALPIWVFNAGISRHEEVATADVGPYVQDALDGIEFARGSQTSKWGALRAKYGHPQPFNLKYVSVGNEDCGLPNYEGNYRKFYDAIKAAYPDIQIISNCDASQGPINHPADLFDFHTYPNAKGMFAANTAFDKTPRNGPKAFVSEYAVWKEDAGNGSLLAAVAEAAFLIGLERNSDIVELVCYAPLFLNMNDPKWIPDAIVFNTYQNYATPSYWLQTLFINSNGAKFLNSTLTTSSPNSVVASAIVWQSAAKKRSYLRIKVVNFGESPENFSISITGLNSAVRKGGSTKTQISSNNVMDENSFLEPKKVVPRMNLFPEAAKDMNVVLSPNSVSSFDLMI